MEYLLAKFAIIFLLAALLGFALGYWWSRRRLIDVTESYSALVQQRSDDEARWNTLNERVSGIGDDLAPRFQSAIAGIPAPDFPTTDLSGLERSLSKLQADFDAFEIPKPAPTDLSGLTADVATLAGKVSSIRMPSLDLSDVVSRIDSLAARIDAIKIPEPAPTDLSGIERQLVAVSGAVDQIEIPASPDLSGIHSELANLKRAIDGIDIPSPDLGSIEREVHGLSQWATSSNFASNTDLAPLAAGIDALSEKIRQLPEPATTDLGPVNARLSALEQAIANLPVVETHEAADLTPIQLRLEAVERALKQVPVVKTQAAPDLSGIDSQLAALKIAIAKIATRPAPKPAKKAGPILLKSAAHGPKDDLKRISGVGPKLERLLNRNGVYYFWQVADWTARDIRLVDEKLDVFKGRISRDSWVKQARSLKRTAGAATKPN
ncbi:MAG: hypothetical protein AAAFM81_00675 [Pseudomonadota bacterium]